MKNYYVISSFGVVCFKGKLFRTRKAAERYVNKSKLPKLLSGVLTYYTVDKRVLPLPEKPRRIHYIEWPI